MNSREKVEAYLRQMAADAPRDNPIAAAAPAMLPMVLGSLPDDSDVLDEVLMHYAATLLALRSDGAEAMHVAYGEADAELEEAPAS